MVGGMVLLAVGAGAAAVKLSQKDAQRIEEHTGASVEELSDDELTGAMQDLGIQRLIYLTMFIMRTLLVL